jgi:hypothetical protein
LDTDPKFKIKSDYDYEDLASKLARQLSLILVGIIILSSIRVVLRGVTRVCIYIYLLIAMKLNSGMVFFSIGTQSIKPYPGRITHAPRTRSDNGAVLLSSIIPPLLSKQTMCSKGIYLLSTIVQMRASFPPMIASSAAVGSSPTPTATTTTTNLFTTIPAYEVFGSLFDWTFLISAGGSLLIHYVRWGVER